MQQAKTGISLTVFKFIWFALFFSIGLHGTTLHMMATLRQPSPQEVFIPYHENPIFLPLVGLAIVLFALSRFLPKYMYKNSNPNRNLEVPTAAQLQDSKSLSKYLVPFLIYLALSEGISVFGFVLSFITLQMEPFFMFAAVAVFNFLRGFPSLNNLKNICE